MNRSESIVRWNSVGRSQVLRPVTLDRLGKSEKFLEDTLAANPELLGIQSRRTGIRGPYAVFQQATLPTPAGRITREALEAAAVPAADRPRVYVGGSTGFVERVADWLVELGHDPRSVRTERYGGT